MQDNDVVLPIPTLIYNYIFYLNMKFLSGCILIQNGELVDQKLVWDFSMDYIYKKFQSIGFINAVFILIWKIEEANTLFCWC